MRKEITIGEAIEIANRRGLKPARVKGYDMVYLTYGFGETIEILDWRTFRLIAERKGLKFFKDERDYIVIARR